VTAEGGVTVVEGAEHTVACCAAAIVAMAGAGPATCEMEGIRVLDFGEAFHLDPYPQVPCLEACQYSVGGGASDQAGVAYAAAPLETEPCCSEAWTAGDKPEAPSAALVFVVSVRSCHTGYWAWLRM
jgi:hypothetical protein